MGRKEREELLLYEYREKRGREGGKGGREGREGATSARGLSHRGEGGVLVCSALSHKCPGQLGCSAFFKVWDGTTPLGSPPSSSSLHSPSPFTPTPTSPALPPVFRAWDSPLCIRPDAGKPPWKCVPGPGGCGTHCYLNRCLAVESTQETR